MNIAMLIARFPPVIGGAEIQCARLSAQLARRGHRVVVLTERCPSVAPTLESNEGVTIVRFRTWGRPPWSSCLYAVQAFFYLLTHRDIELLHAHLIAMPALVAVAAGRLLRRPVVTKIGGGRGTGDVATSKRLRRGRLKLWFFKRGVCHLVCPSNETLAEARALGVPPERLSHIPNGVDIDRFRPATPEIKRGSRQRLGVAGDTLLALYVGRSSPGKGVEHILALCEHAQPLLDFNWRFLLVLSADPPPELKARITSQKERLQLLIQAHDVLPYYNACDLAVLLSEGEGLSNFLLEAFACGLPALASSAAAPDGMTPENGLIHAENPQNTPDLLAALNRLQTQPERLAQLGAGARAYAAAHFGFDRIADAYDHLYTTLRANAQRERVSA